MQRTIYAMHQIELICKHVRARGKRQNIHTSNERDIQGSVAGVIWKLWQMTIHYKLEERKTEGEGRVRLAKTPPPTLPWFLRLTSLS